MHSKQNVQKLLQVLAIEVLSNSRHTTVIFYIDIICCTVLYRAYVFKECAANRKQATYHDIMHVTSLSILLTCKETTHN